MKETSRAVRAFAEEVGDRDPVVVRGGGTRWAIGGLPNEAAREVRAPSGIVAYDRSELTLRCGAGTTVAELDDALRANDQMLPLDPPEPTRCTIGSTLSVGHSGIRRLRFGPIRNLLLGTTFVTAEGAVAHAGGSTVKNVSGFDVCRLLVGSIGTLGLLAEVIVRVLPRPSASCWYTTDVDPTRVRNRLFEPSSVLWDGCTTWVLLEGNPASVAAQARLAGLVECEGPPVLPNGGRRSVPPSCIPTLTGRFVAEVSVGVVHVDEPVASARPERVDLHVRMKHLFDPTGRLAPGRRVA